jgi:hypothetical protein
MGFMAPSAINKTTQRNRYKYSVKENRVGSFNREENIPYIFFRYRSNRIAARAPVNNNRYKKRSGIIKHNQELKKPRAMHPEKNKNERRPGKDLSQKLSRRREP